MKSGASVSSSRKTLVSTPVVHAKTRPSPSYDAEMAAITNEIDAKVLQQFPVYGQQLLFEACRQTLLLAHEPKDRSIFAKSLMRMVMMLADENARRYGPETTRALLESEFVTVQTCAFAESIAANTPPLHSGAKPQTGNQPQVRVSYTSNQNKGRVLTALTPTRKTPGYISLTPSFTKHTKPVEVESTPIFSAMGRILGNSFLRHTFKTDAMLQWINNYADFFDPAGDRPRQKPPKTPRDFGWIQFVRALRIATLNAIDRNDLDGNRLLPGSVETAVGIISTAGCGWMAYALDQYEIQDMVVTKKIKTKMYALIQASMGPNATIEEVERVFNAVQQNKVLLSSVLTEVSNNIPQLNLTGAVGAFLMKDLGPGDSYNIICSEIFRRLGRPAQDAVAFFGTSPETFSLALQSVPQEEQMPFLLAMLSTAQRVAVNDRSTIFEEICRVANVEHTSALNETSREKMVDWAKEFSSVITNERDARYEAVASMEIEAEKYPSLVYIVAEFVKLAHIPGEVGLKAVNDAVHALGLEKYVRWFMWDLRTFTLKFVMKNVPAAVAKSWVQGVAGEAIGAAASEIVHATMNVAVEQVMQPDIFSQMLADLETYVTDTMGLSRMGAVLMSTGTTILTLILSHLPPVKRFLGWVFNTLLKILMILPNAAGSALSTLKNFFKKARHILARLSEDSRIIGAFRTFCASVYASVGIFTVGLQISLSVCTYLDIVLHGRILLSEMSFITDSPRYDDPSWLQVIVGLGVPATLFTSAFVWGLWRNINKRQPGGIRETVSQMGAVVCRYPTTILFSILFAEWMLKARIEDKLNLDVDNQFYKLHEKMVADWAVDVLTKFFTTYSPITGVTTEIDAVAGAVIVNTDPLTPTGMFAAVSNLGANIPWMKMAFNYFIK